MLYYHFNNNLGDNMDNLDRIKLHNCAIHTVLNIDLWDIRLFSCSLLGKDQGYLWNNKVMCPVDTDTYAELSGLEGEKGKAFSKALDCAKKLRDTSINVTLPDGGQVYTSLIYEISYDSEARTMAIFWNNAFTPVISGKMEAGTFTYPKVHMASTSSKRRYSLYLELEKHLWRLSTERYFTLSRRAIREAAGLLEGSYPVWGEVTKRIIKPTLTDIYNVIGVSLEAKVKGDNVRFSRKGALL